MKFTLFILFCLSFSFSFSQNQHSGVIIDSETKEPIEFVGVFNGQDHTVSNADGRFEFSSARDSVIFYRVGYVRLKTTFSQLKDTTYFDKSVFELNEVIVTNQKNIIQIVKDSLIKNYPFESFKERFLLRGVLKINDTLVRLQDIQGKVKRKTLFYPKTTDKANPKDYTVELTNMRQMGVIDDPNGIYVVFPSFNILFNLFSGLNFTKEFHEYSENYFANDKKVKLRFSSNPEEKTKNVSGYYVVNLENYAVEQFYFKSTPKNPTYQKDKNYRFRTIAYEVTVFFDQDARENKYHISLAKFNATIEGTNSKKSFKSDYSINFIMTTYDNFANFKVNKNANITKDIFKLKHPYNSEYWSTQNQLLLTNEMQDFIKKMGTKNTEFKVRSNMN